MGVFGLYALNTLWKSLSDHEAIDRQLMDTLRMACQYIENDETAHGRKFGVGTLFGKPSPKRKKFKHDKIEFEVYTLGELSKIILRL